MDNSLFEGDSILYDFIKKPMRSVSTTFKDMTKQTFSPARKPSLHSKSKTSILTLQNLRDKPTYDPVDTNKAIREKLTEAAKVNRQFRNSLDKQILDIIKERKKYKVDDRILVPKLSELTMKKKISPLNLKIKLQNETSTDRKMRIYKDVLKEENPFGF